MGKWGYSATTNTSVNYDFETFVSTCISTFSYDTAVHTMYNGVDWVYTYVETLYMYDYNILYFWLLYNIYDESIDFFFLSVWYTSIQLSSFQLFWSIILDSYIYNSLMQFSITDEWVRSYISSKDTALFVIHHPEIFFFKNQIYNNYYVEFLSDITLSSIQYLESQSLITPIMLYPQLLFIAYVAFFFVSFYFSFYTNASKEESTVDADYLSASVTVESEKELGSVDDMLLMILTMYYIFGWYFYLYFWSVFSETPEMAALCMFLPVLGYTICSIPIHMIFDFGLVFIVYIKGGSPSISMIAEFFFDYIAMIAYFVRVLIQGIRLVLMFATYVAMHDYVLYMDYTHNFLPGNESFWEELSNVNATASSLTYFILGVIPGQIVNWIYEIFHCFFVVTGQIIAYFGMVFWLFLFLFTSFVSEKQEDYFCNKRPFKRRLRRKFYEYFGKYFE